VTQLPEWAPAGLDVTRAGPARIDDYVLGGARPHPHSQPPDNSDPHPERLAGDAGVGRKG
jgi:hypothetical protein